MKVGGEISINHRFSFVVVEAKGVQGWRCMAYDAMENVVVLKWIMTCIKKGIIGDIKMLLSIWDQTCRRAPDQSSSSGPASKATARTRGTHDGTKCRNGKSIITGTIDIDATHIMSYYLTDANKRTESTRKRFWELLGLYLDTRQGQEMEESRF